MQSRSMTRSLCIGRGPVFGQGPGVPNPEIRTKAMEPVQSRLVPCPQHERMGSVSAEAACENKHKA
jgi:hypothetical protein